MTASEFNDKWTPEPFSGCWLWTAGTTDKGYAAAWFNGKDISGHRLAWQLFKGEIPQGAHVLHRCDVTLCVNPDHLFLGTHADNMRDKVLKLRGTTKLTFEQVLEVKTSQENNTELAKRFGVHRSTIGDIRNGVSWKVHN